MYCGVCEKEAKYKCPRCPLKYCSVVCFKKHKEACNESTVVPESTKESEPAINLDVEAKPSEVEKMDEEKKEEETKPIFENGVLRIPFPLLQKLGTSPELKQLLSNPKMQQMFRDVDAIHNKKTIEKRTEIKEEPKDMEEGEIEEDKSEKPTEMSTAPPQYDLDSCMDDPYFQEIVDVMMKIVGVRDEEGNSIA